MKDIVRLLFLSIFLATAIAAAEENSVIELTMDNPETLIGTNSKDYSICGIRLGMSRQEVEKILDGLDSLVYMKDGGNPDTRIYVYELNPDGTRGKAVFYLTWEPDKRRLGRIAIFVGFKQLTENFRRILTLEALDDSSDFKKKFIGKSSRSKINLDLPSKNSKSTTYFYDKMGLEIHYDKYGDKEYMTLSIRGSRR